MVALARLRSFHSDDPMSPPRLEDDPDESGSWGAHRREVLSRLNHVEKSLDEIAEIRKSVAGIATSLAGIKGSLAAWTAVIAIVVSVVMSILKGLGK